MAEEKYSTPITVTIGMDEYKDIIEAVATIKAEMENLEESYKGEIAELQEKLAEETERSHYNFNRAFNNLEDVAHLKSEIAILKRYKDYVTTDEYRHTAFKAWEEALNG